MNSRITALVCVAESRQRDHLRRWWDSSRRRGVIRAAARSGTGELLDENMGLNVIAYALLTVSGLK